MEALVTKAENLIYKFFVLRLDNDNRILIVHDTDMLILNSFINSSRETYTSRLPIKRTQYFKKNHNRTPETLTFIRFCGFHPSIFY